MPDQSVSPPRWTWLALGGVAQSLVFIADIATPLGFAHGILYVPAVALGLAARNALAIWALVALGIAGTLAGIWLSESQIPSVDGGYILLNRALGLVLLVVAGLVCTTMQRLFRQQQRAKWALEQAAALLAVSSRVGQLGGWRVQLPERSSFWSDEVFRLLDQPPGAVPDIDTIIQRYVPEDRERVREAFEACVAHGEGFDLEVRVLRRDGERRWVHVVGEAVRDSLGQIVRAQGAIQDVHGYKLVQEDLERSHAKWRLLADSLPMVVWVADGDGRVRYMNRFTSGYTGAEEHQLLDTQIGRAHV